MRKTKQRSNVHIWMHYNPEITREEWAARFHRLDHLRIHRVFISGDFTTELLEVAKKHHIEIHACHSILQNNDPELINDRPDWYMVNRLGATTAGLQNWLCMNNPLAVNHVYSQVEQLCHMPLLSGIQMDTIRYPQLTIQSYDGSEEHDDPAVSDFCYCPYCRGKFKNKTGIDPLDIADPTRHQQWNQFRIDTINYTVREITRIARTYGKAITAVVLPTPEVARHLAFQAWDEWDIDAIYPAMFNDFFLEGTQWLARCIHESKEVVSVPIYAGLHLPSFSAEMLDIALDASWEAAGSALYAFENLRHEHDAVLRRRGHF